jgi:hypothetical protein
MPNGLDSPSPLWLCSARNSDTVVHIATFQRTGHLRPPLPWTRCSRGLASRLAGLAILLCLLPAGVARALTLAELRAEPNLTPERLMTHFADFKFELGRKVRPPDAFLASRSGDCDDFATLAADLLREKGYSTRLVAVFMPNDVHVVCYVAETNSYLDYNRRKQPSPLVKCSSELAAIAASVARSFHSPWHSVSEFTFRSGVRRFVSTVFH